MSKPCKTKALQPRPLTFEPLPLALKPLPLAVEPLPLRTSNKFHKFDALPTEIGHQIIRYIWDTYIADHQLNCLVVSCNYPARLGEFGRGFYTFQQANKPLMLWRVNKYFREVTSRLAGPLMITALDHPSWHDSVRGLLNVKIGYLLLHLKYRDAIIKNIEDSFDSLDEELWLCAKVVRIVVDNASARNLFEHWTMLVENGQRDIAWGLNAPLLERWIIQGLSREYRVEC